MVCIVKIYEKPELNSPILIEGLPGIGLVANLAVSFLVKELKAKLFGEIQCSAFQDIAITDKNGEIKFPVSQLYYHKGKNDERDLILLHGNTQALTTKGQYELCWRILEVTRELGCQDIITLGGYRPGRKVEKPNLYFAASNLEMAEKAKDLGAEILGGRIFGVAGLLVALGNLDGMRGFCLLAETPGTYADTSAAREVLKALTKVLRLKVDFSSRLMHMKAEGIASFDLKPRQIKRKVPPKWFI